MHEVARTPLGRRWYAVAAGVVSVALVAGGVVAARGPGPTSSVSARDSDPAGVVPEVVSPSASDEPSATPPAAVTAAPTADHGSALPVPVPVPTVTATVRPTPPALPPAPVENPLVQVSVSDDTLPTATKMIVTVRWRTAPGRFVHVDPDDGHAPWTTDPCYRGEREDVTYGDEWAVARYEWSYRRAGTYDIVAVLRDYPCEGSGSIEDVARSAPRRVHVVPGADVANGPWLPHLDVSFSTDPPPTANPGTDPNLVWGGASTWDPDGWLWKLTIDWGDGSQPDVYGGFLEDCWVGGDYGGKQPYPDTTWPWGGQSGTYGSHDMPGAGTYTVTVKAYSASCEGDDVQVVTKTAQVVVAG